MSKHAALYTFTTGVLEARAIALAERGQFPDGFGRHRAVVDGPTELRNKIRAALIFTAAS